VRKIEILFHDISIYTTHPHTTMSENVTFEIEETVQPGKVVQSKTGTVVQSKTGKVVQSKTGIIFTRYLYIRHEVEISLIATILEKKREPALFWAFELYHSGYKYEVFEILSMLYEDYFEAHDPKLGNFLNRLCHEWHADNSRDDVLASIVINMCGLEYAFSSNGSSRIVIAEKPSYTPNQTLLDRKRKRRIYIVADADQIRRKYRTNETDDSTKILEKECLYMPIRNGALSITIRGRPKKVQYRADGTSISKKYNEQWLYYASLSPVWADRIAQFGGTIDHSTKRVEFPDSDEFYARFQYDPEEQCAEVKSRNIPVTYIQQ